MEMRERRAAEVAKYEALYAAGGYRMSRRLRAAFKELVGPPVGQFCRSYLDVGCGRGESLVMANELEYFPCMGVEPVYGLFNFAREAAAPRVDYGHAHALPFATNSHDVVTCLDVMEHLLPEDAFPSLEELERVARERVVLTISSEPDVEGDGTLHINLQPSEWWEQAISVAFHRWAVRRVEADLASAAWECLR